MNMKKPLALLLAAGMTLGLAACGNGSQGNSESPAPGGETGGSSSGAVELNLWSFNVGGSVSYTHLTLPTICSV